MLLRVLVDAVFMKRSQASVTVLNFCNVVVRVECESRPEEPRRRKI